jgi:diguanylate cyclase (GGDEF)-like protein
MILDDHGTVLGFDEGMEALTGWSGVSVVGLDKDRIGGPGGGAPNRLYDGKIDIPRSTSSLLLRLHARDGRAVDVEAIARRLPGPGERAQVTVLRVLARSPMLASDRRDNLDPLTGTLRARPFRDRVDREVSAALDSARPLALILADVDHLRRINDERGRSAGDLVLCRLADLFRVLLGERVDIGRVGSDDFAALLPGAGRGSARQRAAELRSHVERLRLEDEHGVPIHLTLSLGTASVPADAMTGEDLLARAKDALDEARALGRNRVWCYLRRPRVPLEVPVYFDGSDGLLVGYTRDLSPSGVFVQTAAPIDIGMRCALNFPLPGQDNRVHVIGRVVRSVPPDISPNTSMTVCIPGMGVEFERFGGVEDRRAIESFLHGGERTSLRPETGELSV